MTSERRTPLLVGVGGAIGAGVRWAVMTSLVVEGTFPWPTLLVNVAGSFVLGLVARRDPPIALAVGVGFCGGLTTFSTFAVEVAVLLDTGSPLIGVLTVVTGVVSAVGAYQLGRRLAPPEQIVRAA